MRRITALIFIAMLACTACTAQTPGVPEKTTLRIGMSIVDAVLPAGVTADSAVASPHVTVSDYLAVLRRDGREIGYLRLCSSADMLEEEKAYFLEDPVKNHRALYQSAMPMGSLVCAGQDYTPVYTSPDKLEGTATDRMLYCNDGLDESGKPIDYSHYELVAEPVPPDTRSTWACPLVWGYNLRRGHFVMIELFYDAVTAEELQTLAETLRIV